MPSVISAGTSSNTALNFSGDTSGVLQLASNTGTAALTISTGQQIQVNTGGSASTPVISKSDDTNTGIFFPAADTIAFADGGVESMRIDSSGNLNMSTVGGKVNFATTSSATVNYIGVPADGFSLELACQRGASQPFVYKLDFANGHIWSTAGSERMRIDSSGIIAMGTTDTSNTTRLKVQSGSTTNRATSAQLSVQRNSSSTQYEGICFVSGVAQSAYILRVPNSDDLTFGFDAGGSTTERMRITSGGSVCVNNTTAQGGQPFYVRGFNGTGSAGFQVFSNGSGAIDWYNASAGYVASVVVNSGSVNYNTTSDYRLKENVAPMTGALAKVQLLKPVTYTWKSDGSAGQGFIAHELQAVVPDAVTGEKDAVDAEGNPKYQGVDTSFLVATLTAAIQELKAELDATKAEVAALKGVN